MTQAVNSSKMYRMAAVYEGDAFVGLGRITYIDKSIFVVTTNVGVIKVAQQSGSVIGGYDYDFTRNLIVKLNGAEIDAHYGKVTTQITEEIKQIDVELFGKELVV